MFNGCIFIMTGFRGGKCAVCVAGIFIITQRWWEGGGEGKVERGGEGGAIVDTTSGCLVFRFVGNSSR